MVPLISLGLPILVAAVIVVGAGPSNIERAGLAGLARAQPPDVQRGAFGVDRMSVV